MVISGIRIKYPNYYNLHTQVSFYMSQRPPFFLVYFSWWLPYWTPICFQTCTRKERCTRASGTCAPMLLGHHSHMAQNLVQARDKESIEKNRFEMMDSSPDNCLKYKVLSSFLCFLTWSGAKWKKPSSRASLLHAANHKSIIWIYFTWVVRSIIF